MNRLVPELLPWLEENHSKYNAMLFDIDGTLIIGRKMLPGADAMIKWLRENDFPFYLLTNDGNHSLQEKSGFLKKAGLDIESDEIISCSSPIKKFVVEHGINGEKAFVMGDLGNPNYAEDAGLAITRDVDIIDECACVIVGEGEYDWYQNINAVVNTFIRKPGRPIVVPNPDTYWPDSRGGIGIGAGAKARFMKSVLDEAGVPVELIYLGKPYKAIYEYAFSLMEKKLKLVSLPHQKIIMLGDNLQSDILGANKLGLFSVLMLTGITGEKQAFQAEGELRPDLIAGCFKNQSP